MTNQRGMALILVLLIVAIVVALASAMLARAHWAIASVAQVRTSAQLRQAQLGGERLARELLAADARHDDAAHPRDDLSETWAHQRPVYSVDGLRIGVRIEDLQGRFNINALVRDGRPNALAMARFGHLLRLLSIAPNWTQTIVRHLMHGAALRTSPWPLKSISALRRWGMDGAAYRRLAPHITALPRAVAINLNTADAWVLASLAPGLGLTTGQALVAARKRRHGYANVVAFREQSLLAGMAVTGSGLAVHSQWFVATTSVQMDGHTQVMDSLLKRPPHGEVRVWRRVLRPAAPPVVRKQESA